MFFVTFVSFLFVVGCAITRSEVFCYDFALFSKGLNNLPISDLSKSLSEDDDEGLGDISSEASSPQPQVEGSSSNNNNKKLKEEQQPCPSQEEHEKRHIPSTPADERMPSRITLSVQTTL